MSEAMNPYGADLGDKDARRALRETPEAIRSLCAPLGATDYARQTGPGKWNLSQILLHLAQVEMMFQSRLYLALSTDDYVAQPFDQDQFMAVAPSPDGPDALAAYLSLRHLALPLIEGLTPDQMSRRFRHPDYGDLSVAWLLVWCAGHERRHLGQVQQIAAAR